MVLTIVATGSPGPTVQIWRGIRWLMKHSKRKSIAAELWCLLWVLRDPDTGEVEATREEIAQAIGTTPRQVSRAMTELAAVGVIQRHRRPVPGKPGPGLAVYTLDQKAQIPDP
jgi:Crp-like helix-turn-helix protein